MALTTRPDARTDTHGVERSRHLDHQALHPDDTAIDFDAIELNDLFGEGFHASAARKVGTGFPSGRAA